MPKKVRANVVGQKVMNGRIEVEDVTSVDLPEISHVLTDVDVPGMAGKMSIPDPTRLEAMTLSISHNNGLNSHVLNEPRMHSFEFRTAIQELDAAKGQIGHKSTKFRINGAFTKVSKGTIETGNQLGSTCEYSVFRYEEERDGKVVTLIDILKGIIRINGKDYNSEVMKMLK